MDTAHWTGLIEGVIGGRRVILAGEQVTSWTPFVQPIKDLGADGVFIYGSQGLGGGPPDDDTPYIASAVDEPTIMETIWASAANLADPPAEVREALDLFDPKGEALVLGSFLNLAPDLAGRPFLAHRRPEWLALEDKSTIDGFWDELGIARSPSATVVSEPDALAAAAAALDDGAGTVWSGDASAGFNGGASFVRWVRSVDQAAESAAFYADHCDRVRVMPFLEGIPCSVHGIVFGDDVIALRPVEMVTLRRFESARLFYSGCATFFDPSPEDREVMRGLARTVGSALRDRVAYRGAFTLDGILTVDGFRPTELNPRAGAGLLLLGRDLGIPLPLLIDLVGGGLDLDYRPRELEAVLLDWADENRAGGTWAVVETPLEPVPDRRLARSGDGLRWADRDDQPFGQVMVGPSPIGGFVRFVPEPNTVTPGEPFGPVAAEVWNFLDGELGLGLGPLEPAQLVR